MKQNKSKQSLAVMRSQEKAVSSLAGMLLVILGLLLFSSYTFGNKKSSINLATVKNDVFIPSTRNTVPVYIKKDGAVWIGGFEVVDFTSINSFLGEEMTGKNGKAVFSLYADKDVAFGKIVPVLEKLKNAGFKKGHLVTRINVTPLYYIGWTNDRAGKHTR